MQTARVCSDTIGESRYSRNKLRLGRHCVVILLLVLLFAEVQAQNGWTKKRNLPTPRAWASARVFSDRIYVIGGFHPTSGDFAVNEVYDPLADAWETKQPMPTKRAGLLTAVINDTIYAMGGSNTSFLDINEAYDPITNLWTTKAKLPYTWNGVYGDTSDGIIYIMGGHYYRQNCFSYDPSTNSWTEKTPIPPGGCKGTLSATTYKGLIYTFGGVTNYPNGPMSTVNVYNPNTDTWESKANMPTPRYALRTFLVQDKIYALGGSQENGHALPTVEVYDPSNNTWETLPNMPFKITWFTGAVYDNKIYVFGGTPDWATGGSEVWEYDPAFPTGVEQEQTNPSEFVLNQNYPNPFNPSTNIQYSIPVAAQSPVEVQHVSLRVYDILGKEVATLVNEKQKPGNYEVEWNANELTSGVYFYQLKVGGFIETKKMVLVR